MTLGKIANILKENGPMLSSELESLYQNKYNKTKDAAAQAVSRASDIKKLSICFQDNQKFCFNEEDFGSREFFDKLIDMIKTKANYHRSIIVALENNMGYLSQEDIGCYSSASVAPIKSKRMTKDILQELVDSKVINYRAENSIYSLNWLYDCNYNYYLAVKNIKKNLLEDFNSKITKYNIGGYNTGKYYSQCNNYMWHYSNTCYIHGIKRTKNSIVLPGFIVLDIIQKINSDINDVKFFVDKIKSTYTFKNTVIPILLYFSLSSEAFDYIKKSGIVAIQVKELFGKEYEQALFDFVSSFINICEKLENDPSAIQKIFKELSKNQGRINNMKGSFFELAVGQYFYDCGARYVKFRKILNENETRGNKREIDILIEKDNKILIVECKNTKSSIDKETIQEWLNTKIKDIFNWVTVAYPNKQIIFEYWSANGFDDNALNLLSKSQSSVKKYIIEFYDKNKILNKSKNTDIFQSLLKDYIYNDIY